MIYTQKDCGSIFNFVEIGYKRTLGDTITFKNYVGILQITADFQIEILPKLTSTEIDFKNTSEVNLDGNLATEEAKLSRQIFIKMLNSLINFPGKQIERANIRALSMSLFEIFISMYIEEVNRLIKKGLISSYIVNKENLSFLKGKLQLKEQLQYNFIKQHKLYVGYDEWSINCIENQIIKSTLLFLLRKSRNVRNIKLIRNLLTQFELVDSIYNYDKAFDSLILNRLKREYSDIIQWSKIFLKNQGFSMLSGSQAVTTLLFPMERLFESYVAKYIKRIAREYYYTVTTQENKYWLFDTINGEPMAQFALRPDIVLRNIDNSCCIVVDTKWKQLSKSTRNYGISQADLYQMYAYVKKYNAKEGWLLYPLPQGVDRSSWITFGSKEGIVIKVFFLDLIKIEQSLNYIFNI